MWVNFGSRATRNDTSALRRAADMAAAGVLIDGCVGLTAADAVQRGFEVTFAADAIATPTPCAAPLS